MARCQLPLQSLQQIKPAVSLASLISGDLREHLKERFEKPLGLVDLTIDPELILNLPHETEWRETIGNSKRGNLRHAAKAIGDLIITGTAFGFLAENPRSILHVDILSAPQALNQVSVPGYNRYDDHPDLRKIPFERKLRRLNPESGAPVPGYLLQIRLRGSDPPGAGCQLIPSCRSYPCVGKSRSGDTLDFQALFGSGIFEKETAFRRPDLRTSRTEGPAADNDPAPTV